MSRHDSDAAVRTVPGVPGDPERRRPYGRQERFIAAYHYGVMVSCMAQRCRDDHYGVMVSCTARHHQNGTQAAGRRRLRGVVHGATTSRWSLRRRGSKATLGYRVDGLYDHRRIVDVAMIFTAQRRRGYDAGMHSVAERRAARHPSISVTAAVPPQARVFAASARLPLRKAAISPRACCRRFEQPRFRLRKAATSHWKSRDFAPEKPCFRLRKGALSPRAADSARAWPSASVDPPPSTMIAISTAAAAAARPNGAGASARDP